jgi:hypothetical protein
MDTFLMITGSSHRFFSQAAWKIDNLWRLLAKLIIDRLIGKDAVIVLSGDDTLCR